MFHDPFFFLAQGAAATPQQTASPTMMPTMLVYLVCFGIIIYFTLMRPQSQRQKQLDSLAKSLKTGDKVVTSSGIHGLISNVKESTVIVKIADNVKIEVDKTAIGTVLKRENEPATVA